MTPQSVQLDAGLAGMGLALPPVMREKLLAYLALLYKWNRTYSLTALRDEHKAVSHHLLDSLAILPFVPSSGSLLDVGSGGGMPGILYPAPPPQKGGGTGRSGDGGKSCHDGSPEKRGRGRRGTGLARHPRQMSCGLDAPGHAARPKSRSSPSGPPCDRSRAKPTS